MSPRQAWRAIQAGLPRDAIISSDIGNNCAIGNAYPTFEQGRKYLAPGLFGPCGYGFPAIIGAKIGNPGHALRRLRRRRRLRHLDERDELDRPRRNGRAITMVVFRNYQWGAEKRNSILWYDDNFVGTELNPNLSYAKVAEACGLKGVVGDDAGRADRGASPGVRGHRSAASPPSSRRCSIRSSASRSGATR